MPPHRYGHQPIAPFPHQPPQPRPLAADDNRGRQRVVDLIIAPRRVPGEPDRPHPRFLERLERSRGIRTEELFPASQMLSEIIGVGVQPNKAIVGRNAFAHEAGIHQDGFLKERTTYEIIEPHSVGVPESRLVLGKHSGRHALNSRCTELGMNLDKDQLDQVYARFSLFTDTKKGILDEEILKLANEVLAGGASRKTA